jgi:hypothetical protein
MHPERVAEIRRVSWAIVGAPLAFSLSCFVAAELIGHWPQHGSWFVSIPVIALVLCLYTGARSLFRHLCWSVPIKLAICCAYVIVAFYFSTFIGFVAAFSLMSVFET